MNSQIIKYYPELLPQVFDLFFANTSVKNFKSQLEKHNFYEKWLSPYIEHWNQDFWIAESSEKKLLGYLAGCPSSLQAELIMNKKNASFSLFHDYFDAYPAHFHINVSATAQGQGIGRLLVNNFENDLRTKGINGIHVVTSSDQENIHFYLKLGFKNITQEPLNNWLLVFLGKKLQP